MTNQSHGNRNTNEETPETTKDTKDEHCGKIKYQDKGN